MSILIDLSFLDVCVCVFFKCRLVFRQVKYAVNYSLQTNSLACVGGMIDGKELPLAAAKRELLEETGFFFVCFFFMSCYYLNILFLCILCFYVFSVFIVF